MFVGSVSFALLVRIATRDDPGMRRASASFTLPDVLTTRIGRANLALRARTYCCQSRCGASWPGAATLGFAGVPDVPRGATTCGNASHESMHTNRHNEWRSIRGV